MQPLNSNESKEFNGLMDKDDTYDASAFHSSHTHFKTLHNLAFSALASPGPAFYLDGPNHATTSSLLAAGFLSSDLYTANIFPKTCSLLQGKIPNVIQNNAADALVQNYNNVPFTGLYFDGCGGDPSDLSEMVEALFHRDRVLAPRFVVGFTLTRADARGRTLGDRENSVLRCIARLCRANGYSPPQHVGDDPTRFGVDESLSKEEGGTMTQWVVCEKIR
jgi:hypothetical protein